MFATSLNNRRKSVVSYCLLLALLMAGLLGCFQTATAVNLIGYANPATVSQTAISSTNGNPLIFVPANPYAVGDLIYFTGGTTANNPFTTAGRYFVIYSSGNNIKVATTFNGTNVYALNSITAAAAASQHPDWLAGGNWTGGIAPNDNNTIASFPGAGGGSSTPSGGIVINGNVTTYGISWNGSSQDLMLISGSSNNTSLYPLTFAAADSSIPRITVTNQGTGGFFLGNNGATSSLKINGTQGLVFNYASAGAITSGSGVTAVSANPSKVFFLEPFIDWSGFSGGIQIERGVVQQNNNTSQLPTTQSLTVGNAQTLVNQQLAGFNLNGKDCTIDSLNGNSLGRVYCGSGSQSLFKIGNNNGNGSYTGDIGINFDGTIPAGNVWLHKAGTGTQTISGPIVGTNTQVVVDSGTLILTAANTYKGITTVNAGKLQVSSAQLTTNTITVASGATLDISVTGASQLTPSTLTLSSTATTIEFLNLASTTTAPVKPGTMALNGAVTVNINSGTVTPGNNYPLVNWTTIGGSGGFVLGNSPFAATLSTNSTTLVLNVPAATTNVWTGISNGNWDTNTVGNWTGGTGIYANGGVAVFDDTATGATNVAVNQALVKPGLALFNNSNLTYSVNSITGTNIGGAGGVSVSGGGTVSLTGPNIYSGGTTLSAGQLNLNYGGSSSANSAIGTGGLTISGGKLDNTSSGDVTLAPAIAQNWSGSFAYIGSIHNLNLGSGAVTLGAGTQVAVTNNTLTVSGAIGDGGLGYSLTKVGNGTLTLGGANSFSGGMTLIAGTLQVGNSAALGTGGSQLNGGVLDLNGTSLASSNNINNTAFVLTNSSASTGALAANSIVNANFTIGVGTGNISVARLIDLGSPLTVTKVGTGTLNFNGAGHNNLMAVTVNDGAALFGNTGGFTADRGVTLNAGTIKLNGTGSGGSSPNANLIGDNQPFAVNGGTFDLNGWNETVATVNGTNGVILNNAAGTTRTLTIGGDNGTNAFAGAIQNGSGTLALKLIGTGIQILSGLNTYTGGTTITNTATLQAGTNNVLPTAGGDVNVAGGTLDLNGFNNAINGLNGAGTVDNVTNTGSATLTVGANGNSGNFSGAIQNTAGTLSLTKTGAGTQILSGTSTYGGSTTISNGTLVVSGSLAGNGAVTVYAPGVLNASNASPSIAGAVILSGTNATLSLLDGAINTLTLNGNLTLTSSNVLRFDVSSGSTLDTINVNGTFAQTGKTAIYINALTSPDAFTSIPLITIASGSISAGNFTLGNTLPGVTLSLTSDPTHLYLNVVVTAPTQAYWHNHNIGAASTAWNGHTGSIYNWDTDQSSAINTATVPSAPTDVFFAANGATNFNTTLGADFTLKSLTFNVASNVTIGGANALTLNGALTVNSGAGTNTISAGSVVLGADQNVNVADAGNTLTISSPISGGHAFNVNPSSGSGKVVLSGSSSFTGGTIVNSGTLALNNPTNTLPDTGAVNVNGGTLNIGTNSDTVGAVTLTSGLISGSSGVLTGSSYNVQSGTVAANLGGTAAMTMTGSSVLLASNSTYSGGTTISSGTLQLGASNALGSGSVTLGANSLDLNGQTIPNVINFNGAGTLRNDGATAAVVTTDANVTSNPTIDTTGGDITIARLIGTGATRTVTKTGANALTFNGAGHNNLVKLVVNGGTVVCANSGGYSADRGFELDSGIVKLAGPGSGGSSPNANLFNDTQEFWLLGSGGTFDLNGWNETVATVYAVGGTVIENTATGTNSTLTVGADNGAANNTISGTLQDGGGVLSIAKTGTGVQILNGTSTYSGSTTINNGQLQVTASGASPGSTFVVNTNGGLLFQSDTGFTIGGLSGTGNIVLANDGGSAISLTVGGNNIPATYSGVLSEVGAGSTLTKIGTNTLTLSGANTYTGLTTANNGVLLITPNYVVGGDYTVNEGAVLGVSGNTSATSAQIGTLQCGISGTGVSTLLFTSLPVPTNAPVTVGTLSPVGSAGSVIISNTAALNVGTYNLINYTTLTGAGFSALTLAPLPPGTSAHLNNNTAATPKVIQIVVTAVAPQVWSGAVNTNWDVASTLNWKLSGASTNYHNASPVLFDDTVGSGQTTVNLTTNVQPNSVTVSNITKNYTIATVNGSGISAYDGFTKKGAGTVTLVNLTNSFAGAVNISAGTLVLSSSSFGGSDIVDNGSLVYSNGTPVVSIAVSGSGTLVQNGTNTLELAGTNNSYAGGTVIKSGTLQSDNAYALGTGPITLGDGTTANNATLQGLPGAGFANTNPIVVAAGGSGSYGVQWSGSGDYTLSGHVALNNAVTLRTTAGGALFMNGSIISGGANPNVTIDGAGTTTKQVYLNADNASTFTGNLIVTNKGGLKVGNTNALSSANTVSLDSTAFFDNGSMNVAIAGLNDYSGVGGTVAAAGSGKFLTLGGSGSYAFSGVIVNIGGIVKAGSGQQTLAGVNTYSGPTVVSNGTLVVNGSLAGGTVTVNGGVLSGTGTLNGATTVPSGGTLSPGGGGIGTLTVSNSLTLAGNTVIQLNKSLAQSNDVIAVSGALVYGGTLAVTNLGGSLVAGDAFRIFKSGGSGSVTLAGDAGSGLSFSFSDGVLTVVSAGPGGPAMLTNSVSGSTLSLSWPAGQGWLLQMQTNNLSTGLGTNWMDVPGSTGISSTNITLDLGQPAVFYRLKF